jgi:dienelactone hydrolase
MKRLLSAAAFAWTFFACVPAFAQPTASVETVQVSSSTANFVRNGRLFLPDDGGTKVPVVLFLPGTDGMDQRLDFYRPELLNAGIGVLEIDTKTGVFTNRSDRPRNDYFESIAFGALTALQANPRVDPAHIGVMGWSAGATASVGTAWAGAANAFLRPDQPRFAAHVGLYGGCTQQVVELTGAPILVLQGAADTDVPAARCRAFSKDFPNLVTYVEYPGVYHEFDKSGRDIVDRDGNILRWNKPAAEDARARVLAFFVNVLKPQPPK